MNEATLLNLIRLEASQKGSRLWRNNVGAAYTKNGDFLRYGLANDSTKINSQLKSSDLIGIKPIRITQDMVGLTIGQFLSYEIKNPNWKFSGTDRELAQLNWINLITDLGGDARFIIKKEAL